MSRTARSKEQLLDLLLLGLTWLHEDSPGFYGGWRYNGIFQTIRLVGAVSEDQFKHIAGGNDDVLNQFLTSNGAFAFPHSQRPIGRHVAGQPLQTALPSQSTCSKLVAGSDKLLVILVNRPLFDRQAMVTPRGFPLLATERGQEHAHRVAARYERELPADSFRAQWKLHSRAMRGMHAAARGSDG